jgi:acid phosphatase
MNRIIPFHSRRAYRQPIVLLGVGLTLVTSLPGQNMASSVETAGRPPGPSIKLPAPPPIVGLPNFTLLKEKLTSYHDCTCTCGCYERDLERVGGRALAFLKQYLGSPHQEGKKPAVVIDVDDTALSNWDNMKKMSFAYNPDEFLEWEREARAPAIRPVLELFQYARDHGVSTIFLTSRAETQREVTVKDLEAAGYKDWTTLLMRKPDSPRYAVDFKSAERKKLKESRYLIIVNIGDQDSDLAGEPSLGSFKLPNPFYYLR